MSYPSAGQEVAMGIPVNCTEKVPPAMPQQPPPLVEPCVGSAEAVVVNITTKDDNLVPAGLVGFLFGECGLAGVFCVCNTPKGRLGGCAGFTSNKFCHFLILLVLLIVALSSWHKFPADNREDCTANGGTWLGYREECLCPILYSLSHSQQDNDMCVPAEYLMILLIAVTVVFGVFFVVGLCFTGYFYSRRNDPVTNVVVQPAYPTTENAVE